MSQISEGPSLDALPADVLQIVYHHLHNGVALSRACLVSRRLKEALWDNDHLWHEAFEGDWGRLAANAVELYGTAQKTADGTPKPTQPSQVLNWRSLYAAHHSFVGRVNQERERKSAARLAAKRAEYESEARQLRTQRQGRQLMATFKRCSPLLSFVILPALLVLLILRAEAVIMWSFHIVFIPADFLFLFGCWFFALFTRDCNSRARPFIISCSMACLAAIPTLHWAAARGDWIAAHGNRPSTYPGSPTQAAPSHPPTTPPAQSLIHPGNIRWVSDALGGHPRGLNWMGIFAPMLACCIAYSVLICKPILHRPQDIDLSLVMFLLSGLPLIAFLVLLGYKLQWGGPGFLYTYAFIPLFLYPIGLQIGLISALKSDRQMIALSCLVVVLPFATILILIVLRLDWTVHTAFIAIPTAFWLLPLMVLTIYLACDTANRASFPTPRTCRTLSRAENSAIEEQLSAAFGPHIYRARDERTLLNRTVVRLQLDASNQAQTAPESFHQQLEDVGWRVRLLDSAAGMIGEDIEAGVVDEVS
ncbi:hypothetical protein PAPYR_2757 [Paratrimastix pyriformis]|uniref:F-box domain-containing protein n=1 Tax=Paratrimastix pyriformis TaxID=342808 RepID=A0ABQ8UQY0_9EUKA|nr:hypothetical protein PAPYR_2757 [Paratrimastix pyriformis]